MVGDKGRICRSENEFRLEGGWGTVRMVMRGGEEDGWRPKARKAES